MPAQISSADLQILLHEADATARRLRRRLRLSPDDLADLRQDLLVDALARLRSFDPACGSLGAFAGIVMANRAARIASRTRRERWLYGVSLDEPIPGAEGTCRGDLVAEEDGLSALHGQPVDAFTEVERRIDVERGLAHLVPADGALCAALSHTTVERLAAAGRGARSSLYRRVAGIRLSLMATGLRAA